MDVSVTVAGATDKALIEGLAELYVYDFSELEPADSDRFEVDATGRFARLPGLDDYWTAPGSYPLIIRVRTKPAGFALLNTHSHRGGTVARNMGEFFVLRKHRRHGVAGEALKQILGRYPGQWEIAVAQRNAGALAFWPRAIAAANVSDLVRHEGDGVEWRGPIWSFVAGAV